MAKNVNITMQQKRGISSVLATKNPILKAGEVLLVPAEIPEFTLVPAAAGTVLLEVMLEPQPEPDGYINRDAEPYLDGEDYNGLEGEDFTDWAGPHILN